MNVKLALEINKLVHNECKDAPHDIGIRIEELVNTHYGKGKKLNILRVIARYFFRALGLPFFIALSLIGAFRGWIRYVIDYCKWGGEAANYTKNRNPKTIADVFDEVQKNNVL